MRITTANAHDQTVAQLQRRQQELAHSQEQMTSGKRVQRASDDPVAAARAERALAQMVRTEANQRAIDASRNAMQQAESALGDAGDLLQEAREQVVAAGNGSYTDAERAALASQIKGIRDQLLGIANRSDGAGGYLFGGQGTATPFADEPGGVVWRGANGRTTVPAGDELPMTLDGSAWLSAVDPVTGNADLSVFDVLDRIVAGLETPGQDGEAIDGIVKDGLRDLDATMSQISSQRTAAGEVLSRTDDIESRNADSKLAAQTERSNAEDLDMVQAISDFQTQQTSYSAALQSYATVQRLSLFDYLSA